MYSVGLSYCPPTEYLLTGTRSVFSAEIIKGIFNPERACARGLQYSLCVSVCLSAFFIVEKAPFSGLKLTSIHSR